uniref:Acyl_transf_3 domain-containing protein n=1 Tax=Steinernema glaseri TaxID=37863 RepID=A0A1I7YRE3_9BILA
MTPWRRLFQRHFAYDQLDFNEKCINTLESSGVVPRKSSDERPLLAMAEQPRPAKRKRDDLQSLRGYAIVLVILFHLFPEEFSVGFTGVDIFFVLSGYLMSSIYGRSTTNFFAILRFYEKRYIRLLPLYGLTIVFVIFYGYYVFTAVDYEQLFEDSRWALTLATNFKSLFDKSDYFTRVTQFKFLLHTWSLCLEMQYYLVAPALFYFERRGGRLSKITIATVFVTSLLAHFYFSGPMSFEILCSRIWQFQCGYFAYSLDLWNCSMKFTRVIYYLCLLGLSVLVIPYFSAPEKPIRLMATLCSLCFIGLGRRELGGLMEKVVNQGWLIYIGDVSYVWYLVHWPTIFYVKYLNIHFTLKEKFIAAAVSFGISVVVHHLIEKPLLNKRIPSALVFLGTFAIAGACLTGHIALDVHYPQELHFQNRDCPENVAAQTDYFWRNETLIDMCADPLDRVQQAINLNMYYAGRPFYPASCKKPKKHFQLSCILDGTGDLRIVMFGNSFSQRALPALYEIAKDRYHRIEMIIDGGCEALLPTEYRTGTWECAQMQEYVLKRVRKVRPHITIYMARFFEQIRTEPIENVENDKIYHFMKGYVGKLMEHSGSFIISGTLPFFWHTQIGDDVARRLKVGLPLHDLNHNRKLVENHHAFTFQRIEKLCGEFDRCLFYDVSEVFCMGRRICHVYDPDTLLAYYEDNQHLSFKGIEKTIPSFRRVINDALKFSNVPLLEADD